MTVVDCTSNHILGRVIWDKLPQYIFENFKISKCSKVSLNSKNGAMLIAINRVII